MFSLPNASFLATISSKTDVAITADSLKFKNPGPATSIDAIPAVSFSIRAAISSAMSREGLSSLPDRIRAMLHVTSPWLGSRGRSRSISTSPIPIPLITALRAASMGSQSTIQLSDLEPGDLDPELSVSDLDLFFEVSLLRPGEDFFSTPESESDLLVAPPLSDEAFFL